MQNPKNLKVYKEAFDLSKEIYKLIENKKCNSRIKNQILGSSTAICANLAEMSSFDNTNQIIQKIRVCVGETNETEFWLDFMKEIELIKEDNHNNLINKTVYVRKLLLGLLKSILAQNSKLENPKTKMSPARFELATSTL